MQQLKAYLLCHNAAANQLYNSWCSTNEQGIPHEVVEEYDETWEPPADCGVVVSHLHYDFPTAAILKRITTQNQVPVLVLCDGILEYRNTFSNPGLAAGSLFMPVHGHRIACLGASQARHIDSWGNAGKTEIVGLPRLDGLRGLPIVGQASQMKRILIVTARQPGFTDRQLDAVQKSLIDLRNWFAKHPTLGEARLEPVWRLTGNLAEKLGVPQDSNQLEQPISEVLQSVSAVISTPSTTVVESMLLDLPTAILDYTNSPKFISSAWNINTIEHFSQVIPELLDPAEPRMLFQRGSLADAVQIDQPATDRMVRLVKRLMEHRARAIETQSELEMDYPLLESPSTQVPVDKGSLELSASAKVPVDSRSLKDLFPCQIGFQANELESLTTQYQQLCQAVSGLHQRIDTLRNENALARQQVRIANRHQEYVADQVKWLRTEIQRLNLALRISRRPTRLHRRLRVRASIAYLRWQYFVEIEERSQRKETIADDIDSLFELTAYPKGNKIPATIRNYQANPKAKPRIKMWKFRPTNALLCRMGRSIDLSSKRQKARRVMRAN